MSLRSTLCADARVPYLSFPDIAVESLQKTIPDRNTRILIYCNNNFRDA